MTVLTNKPTAKETGDQAELEVAKFFQQHCIPTNMQLGVSPRGALAFDIATYSPDVAYTVPEGFKFHANVEVRMSDYIVVKQKTKHWEKLFISSSSGLDPLDLSSLGVANVEVVTHFTKRAGGSIKDEQGNKLFRHSCTALRFKPAKGTPYVELTPEVCEQLKQRISFANTVTTFDVKVGKGSQLGGVSVTASLLEPCSVPTGRDSPELQRLVMSACTNIVNYLTKLSQNTTSFKVLIDLVHAQQKGVDGVPESLYNTAKLNVKLVGEVGDERFVYQSLARTPCHSNTHFILV